MPMTADGPSEMNEGTPDRHGDALAHGRERFSARSADDQSEVNRQTETRFRGDYFDSVWAAERAGHSPAPPDRGADTRKSSAWDDGPMADHPERPARDSLRLLRFSASIVRNAMHCNRLYLTCAGDPVDG
jgi:hypothetical protein